MKVKSDHRSKFSNLSNRYSRRPQARIPLKPYFIYLFIYFFFFSGFFFPIVEIGKFIAMITLHILISLIEQFSFRFY